MDGRMPPARMIVCSLCGIRVREDNLLHHRNRVHPRELTSDERTILEAREAERVRLRPPASHGPVGPATEGLTSSDGRSRLASHDASFVDRQPTGNPADWLLHPRERAHAPTEVPPSLWVEIQAADRLLNSRCGERLIGDDEEGAQALFADLCQRRWIGMAEADEALVRARERLHEADLPKFQRRLGQGLEQRRRTLTEPLRILRDAGERAVPHLAMMMMTDSWASILAVEDLEVMPSSPLRDRALVEALFLPGDWIPEAGERAARTMDLQRRWPLFEAVAREAEAAHIELQSLYWTALFEQGPEEESERRPTPDLERAAILLYDLGHHSALVAGLDFLLDPAVSGHERVQRNLREGRLAGALVVFGERAPERRPTRLLVEP